MKVSKIYFDMDGVLADFDRGVRELCGLDTPDQNDSIPGADDRMWEAIRDTDHFYDRLELMPGAKEMFDAVYAQYGDRCEILTGIPKAKRGIVTAEEDKRNWMKRILSEKVEVNVCFRAQKIDKCTGADAVLIDDLEKNIREWTEAGGTGILHVSAEKTLAELKRAGILDMGGEEPEEEILEMEALNEPGGMLFGDVSPEDNVEPEESAGEINRRFSETKGVYERWKLIFDTGGIWRFESLEDADDDEYYEPFEGFPVGETSEDMLFKVTKGNNAVKRGETVGVGINDICDSRVIKV